MTFLTGNQGGVLKKKVSKRKQVSISWELWTLQGAAEAARVVVEAVANDAYLDEGEERRALRAAVSTLELVDLRLRDLTRLIAGTVDPSAFASRYNTQPDGMNDSDVRFAIEDKKSR